MFIGYIGTDSIGSLIKRFAAGAGVEDEINNQRKAFLDMLAWSEGMDNGRQKTRNHGYDVIVVRRAFRRYSRSPSQTCHAKPKTQPQAPDATSFFPVGGMPTAVWPERLLSESQDAVALQQIKERGALTAIDRGDIRQAPTVAAISGSLAGRWLCCSEHKADSLIANSKKRRNG